MASPIEEVVRSAQSPRQAPGFKPAPTRGLNPDVPQRVFGDVARPTDTGPFARKDKPEDFARQPQLGKNIVGGHEACSAWRDVSGSVELDLNACVCWRLYCHSSALSITFAPLDPMPANAEGTLWETQHRVATVQIIISWQVATGSARSLEIAGEFHPDGGVRPEYTAAIGIDVVMAQVFSDGGFVLVYDDGRNMKAP